MRGTAKREREHALRNALNTLEISLTLARHALDEGNAAQAAAFMAQAELSCSQCRATLGSQDKPRLRDARDA